VSQVRGTELFVQHAEKHISPTVTPDQILGGKPFEFSAATAGKKRTQILLLGDSSTEASFPKKFAPDEPQLEDTLRSLLAIDPGLPPCDVWNEGVSGKFIRGLLDTRYDRAVKTKPQADGIFTRLQEFVFASAAPETVRPEIGAGECGEACQRFPSWTVAQSDLIRSAWCRASLPVGLFGARRASSS
jgi:hypothetical protein